MTAATAGVGTTLQVGDGASPEIFSTIAEVLTIGGPEISSEDIEVTNMDSPSGFKEFISGLTDAGAITFDANWIKSTQQTQVRDDVGAGTARNYRITWPDSPATIANFNARATAFSMSTDPNAQLQASISLKISGVVSWT